MWKGSAWLILHLRSLVLRLPQRRVDLVRPSSLDHRLQLVSHPSLLDLAQLALVRRLTPPLCPPVALAEPPPLRRASLPQRHRLVVILLLDSRHPRDRRGRPSAARRGRGPRRRGQLRGRAVRDPRRRPEGQDGGDQEGVPRTEPGHSPRVRRRSPSCSARATSEGSS